MLDTLDNCLHVKYLFARADPFGNWSRFTPWHAGSDAHILVHKCDASDEFIFGKDALVMTFPAAPANRLLQVKS